MRSAGLDPGDFAQDPQAWQGITWGLVEGFKRWLLAESYAVGSVNVCLTTVRVYAALAAQAGIIPPTELTLIRSVKGYRRAEGKHIDELRAAQGQAIRRKARRDGSRARKKAAPVGITPNQAAELKAQPDTPQGRRDALIVCLLLDHGLRVGEVAGLRVDSYDLKAGELRFYRPKVDRLQTHKLTPDTLAAARAYLAQDAPALGSIWRGSRKNGELAGAGMGARAITARVKALGAAVGIPGLSPHDCRHYWATQAARSGTQLERLKDAGGWSSLAMPERYIEAARIANQGVLLE